MAQPYVGEIRMFGGNFAPAGWQFCNGQLLPISEYETLFNLIGTTYGGDGTTTFALPDLRGRLPLHQGNGFTIAQASGVEQVTLTAAQMPSHAHPLMASASPGTTASPGSSVLAKTTTGFLYINEAPTDNMAPTSVSAVGGSQPHSNMQPYLCVSFIISMFGIYPSPT